MAAVLVTVISNGATAQDRLPAATGTSESEAFRPQGYPAGGFRIYPTLRLSTDYDDNISRSNDSKRGDGSFIVAPTIAARSNWSNHQLNSDAFYRSTHYFTRTAQNHDEYGANVDGRLDVMRTWKISGDAGYARLAETRGTPGDLFFSNRLIRLNTYNAGLQVSNQFNRINATIGASTQGYRYDDVNVGGVIVDQGFRNRNVNGVNGRLEYQYSALTGLYVSGSYTQIDYRRALPTFDRSSRGFSALGGVRFELSRLLSGQVGLGYIKQDFADPRFANLGGLNYNLSLKYQPTDLTSFSATASRRLTDSSLFAVVGVLTNDFRVSVEHELLRSLLLQGFLGYSNYNYRGINRVDNRFDIGAGARYRMNRFASLALSGEHVGQDAGDILGRSYSSNRATLSVILSR